MKPIRQLFILMLCLSLGSCIQDDIVNDRVDPVLRIDNPLETLGIGETYQLEATYLNNIGQEELTTLSWNTSDSQVLEIDEFGNITARNEGSAIVTVTALDLDQNVITAQDDILVTDNTNEEILTRSGTIVTTSSYSLSGNFVMEEVTNDQVVKISIADDYVASTALPGLYLYLTNNPNSINGAYEVGAVTVFSGEHTYEIPTTEVSLNRYSYLLYWCKPFSVKVGEGKIE